VNLAPNTEQLDDLGKHGDIADVQADHVVSDQLCDVSEVARAAADIKDALRRGKVEFEAADAANVDVDPTSKTQMLKPIFAVMFDPTSLSNLLEFLVIYGLN
jgi:hypothetical protein